VRRGWRSAVRFCAYGAAILGALLTVAALFLPNLLDTPRVRAGIQRILSEAVAGEVAWEDLRIRVLPAPHGVLHRARLEIPSVASVSAEEAKAYLRLWPLLRGRVEITSVSVTRPAIRINVVPDPAAKKPAPDPEAKADIFETYRSLLRPVVEAVRKYAPDTVVAIEDGELEVRVPDTPPMQLSKLWLRVRTGAAGVGLDATAASRYWSGLTLSARLEYADLSARATFGGRNIAPQAWLERYLGHLPVGVSITPVRLQAVVRTDATTSVECEFDAATDSVSIARAGERIDFPGVGLKGSGRIGAQETIIGLEQVRLGGTRLAQGELHVAMKNGAVSGHSGYDLDLAQGMDVARRLVPARAREVLASFNPVTGRAQGRVKLAFAPAGWSVGIEVHKSDGAVQVGELPGPVRLGSGAVLIDSHGVRLDRVALSMPAGSVLLATLQHHYRDGATTGNANIDLDVAQSLELARRALPPGNRETLADIETATGRVEGRTTFALSRDGWKGKVDVSKSDATLGVRQLPGPVGITGLSVEANPASVTIGRAALSLMDANVVASATFDEYDSGPRIRGAIAEGSIGEKLLAWVWNTVKLPARYEPVTPIRIADSRIAWHPTQGLEVRASAQFDAGPSVAVDLGWDAGALDIRRATIKDGRSDAELALRAKGAALEGRFAGSLSSASVASVLKRAKMPSGVVTGDLRFTIDRENPRRMTADGHLKGEALDLAALTGQPLKIERIDLMTDDTALHVREATVDWAGQRVTLRGDLRRSEKGPIIVAQLDSPGIDLDVLLPREAESAAVAGFRPAAGGGDAASRLWPLPVTGRIEFRSDFVQSGRHKVAPLAGILTLEERRAHVDLTQADLCGISLPLVFEVTPRTYSVSARITAQKQQLEQSAHCLTGEGVLISGLYDLDADIRTQGRPAELLHNLIGTIRTDAQDGKVMKFALLGNILSMGNIASLMKQDGPKLDAQGFPYRKLIVAGRFEKGQFLLDEGVFQSDALGLAANGWIALDKPESRLTVLVAPFGRIDRLVRDVPLVGYIVGGAFTSVPVGVSGDIRDPLVVPLGPAAVGSEALGIFERTLKLPVKLVTPAESK